MNEELKINNIDLNVKKLPIHHQVYKAYVEAMKACAENDDGEEAHRIADRLLTDFLEELGCKELVNAFYNVERWYS